MQCCDVCEWRHRALYRSSPITPNPLANFCDQVFFDYVPSSAASLLSSVGISTRPSHPMTVIVYVCASNSFPKWSGMTRERSMRENGRNLGEK